MSTELQLAECNLSDLEIINLIDPKYLPGLYNGRLIPHGPFLEEWKDINGYDGQYKISNYGRVKSRGTVVIKRKDRYKKDKIMSAAPIDEVYLRVCLSKNNVRKDFKVHRLVGFYFLDPVPGKDLINHIRGFGNDNMFTQIEWATPKENSQHSFHVLGHQNVLKYSSNASKRIQGFNIETHELIHFDSITNAEKNGFSRGSLKACCNGKIDSYKGYKFKFINN